MRQHNKQQFLIINLLKRTDETGRDAIEQLVKVISKSGAVMLCSSSQPELFEGDWFGDGLLLFHLPEAFAASELFSEPGYDEAIQYLRSDWKADIVLLGGGQQVSHSV